MRAEYLLTMLAEAGVAVGIVNGSLRLSGSTAVLHSEVIQQVRANRDAMIALLIAQKSSVPIPLENDCNTATPPNIMCQLPEEIEGLPTVAVDCCTTVAVLPTATPTPTAEWRREPTGTVAVTKTATPPQHPTATPITSQQPEENMDGFGDRCSVAVDLVGVGTTLLSSTGAKGSDAEQLAQATADYERRYHDILALHDAGRHAEARLLLSGYWAAGDRMAALQGLPS